MMTCPDHKILGTKEQEILLCPQLLRILSLRCCSVHTFRLIILRVYAALSTPKIFQGHWAVVVKSMNFREADGATYGSMIHS